jgi:hypothetical protein
VDNAAYTSAYFVNASNTVGINLIKYSFAWEIKHQKRAYPGIIFFIYCAVFVTVGIYKGYLCSCCVWHASDGYPVTAVVVRTTLRETLYM